MTMRRPRAAAIATASLLLCCAPAEREALTLGTAAEPAGPFVHFVREGSWFEVTIASPRAPAIELSAIHAGAFRITDPISDASVSVSLSGAAAVAPELGDASLTYRRGYQDADIVQRIRPDGLEDFVLFEREPGTPQVSYALELGDAVAGLRLVANTLELLDEHGVPRLRVAPPWIEGADAIVHPATLALEGCDVDRSPAAPFGRATVPPGSRQCVLNVSWSDDVRYPATLDPAWTLTTNMAVPRRHARSTLLNNGRVLVAGGHSSYTLSFCELFDPAFGTWTTLQSLATPRAGHVLVTLGSGHVLAAAGENGSTYLTSAERYDPIAETWSSAGSMAVSGYYPTASVLPDGRVLVAGGYNGAMLSAAATYDPATNSWSSVSPMATARAFHTAQLLASGQVLVAGGMDTVATTTASAELFDPSSNSWSATASMAAPRSGHTSVALLDGTVLAIGGFDGLSATLASVERYDPTAQSWSAAAPMAVSRAAHTASLLADGTVIVAGGYQLPGFTVLTSSERYLTNSAVWATEDNLNVARESHMMTLLLDGRALAAGGYTGNAPTNTAELYTAPPLLDNGIACTTSLECLSGHCVDGVCCDSSCNGDCQVCAPSGVCGDEPDGTPCSRGTCMMGSCEPDGSGGAGGGSSEGGASQGGASEGGASQGGASEGGASEGGTSQGAQGGEDGMSGNPPPVGESDEGCGCRVAGADGSSTAWLAAACLWLLGQRRRRRLGIQCPEDERSRRARRVRVGPTDRRRGDGRGVGSAARHAQGARRGQSPHRGSRA